MPQDLFELLQKAYMLFMRGSNREALELLTNAEQLALEDERPDALAAILGRLEDAQFRFDEVLKMCEALLNKDPENVQYQSYVARTQNILGHLLSDMDRLEDAKFLFEQVLKMCEALLNRDPENAQYQSSVAITKNNLGVLLYQMGRLEDAHFWYEQALKMFEEMLNRDPEDAQYQSEVATTQNNLGSLLDEMGRREEAKIKYEQALGMRKALLNKDPENAQYQSDMAMTHDNLGGLLRDMGMLEEAKIKYEQALGMRKALLNRDPENAQYQSDMAMTQDNLGDLLCDMGRREEAKIKYEQALEIGEALLNRDPKNVHYQLDIAMTKNNLAGLLCDMGRHEDAKLMFEQALKMFEVLLNRDPENMLYRSYVAGTKNNLGILLCDTMGKYEDAKSQSEEALLMQEVLLNNDPKNVQYQSDVAMTQNNLGILLYDIGKLEDAQFMFEQALKMYEAMLNRDPENAQYLSYVATTQNNLGSLLDHMGRLEEAKIKYEQALGMRKAMLKRDPENALYQSDVAMTQSNLGLLLRDLGRHEDAQFRFEQALKMREVLLNGDLENAHYQLYVAKTKNNLGTLLSRMERFDKAKIRFEQALKMYEAMLNRDSENALYQSDVAMTLNNLGLLLKDMKRLDEAKIRYGQALKMYEAMLNRDLEKAHLQLGLATILLNIGDLLLEEGKFSEALVYFSKALNLVSPSSKQDLVFKIFRARGHCHDEMGNLKQAYNDYRESIERIELIRSQFSQEEYKLDIMGDKEYVYSDMISLLCIKENEAGRAWEYVGRAKSRTLLDFLRFIELPVPQSIPKNLQSKEKELLESIRIRDRQARTTEKADQAYLLSQEITKLQSELGNLYDQLEEFAPEYVDLRRGEPLTIDKIIDLLKNQSKKTAFVEFYTTPEQVFIFVMSSEDSKPKVKIVDISSQQLWGYVMRYYHEIENYPYMPGVEETWQELAEYLIDPIMDDIDGCEILHLIPHGLLHYLPIHALYINGKRLIERFPVAYASSLTAIEYAQRKGGEKLDSCLSMGYTPNEDEKKVFEGEASLVANLFKTEAYLDRDATSQLLTNTAKDVIHVSCHGSFDQPLYVFSIDAALVEENLNKDVIAEELNNMFKTKGFTLSENATIKKENDDEWEIKNGKQIYIVKKEEEKLDIYALESGFHLSNGMLTARDIFSMNIKANLLVLSACESGLNEQKPGDEQIGLTRAFLYSGAGSIMVSLWSVNADSTLKLMESFYNKIKNEKMSKAEALQKAQIEMMQDARYAHPYYWAPFILIGDWK
jgi:CHAT domain-containing protein/Tfp pilus assembly protein PilF